MPAHTSSSSTRSEILKPWYKKIWQGLFDKNKAESASSQPLENTTKKSDPWYTKLGKVLFWVGASASAMQGFFSIESFITTTAAIPGMAFLYLTPYALIFISACIICFYSIRVEQQIFYPNFIKLINQLAGNEDTINRETQKLKTKIAKLRARKQANPSEATTTETEHPTENSPPPLSENKYLKLINNYIAKITASNLIKVRIIRTAYKCFAYLAAGIIVGLRAIVSIGSTMLGIKILFGIVASVLGITLPAIIIPLCALMAAVGYFIKTSQNIIDQFNETLKKLGLKLYIKTDLKKAKKEYIRILKDKDNNSHKEKADLPKWKIYLYNALRCGFIFGAIGASAQGFFSIDKFVHSLGSVPAFAFFNLIPFSFIIGAAIIIACYTLFVEQKILYQYYEKIIGAIVNPESNKNVTCTQRPDPETDYKLKALRRQDYTIITETGSDEVYTINFHSKLAYKIYKLNAEIDALCNNNNLPPRDTQNQTKPYVASPERHWFTQFVYINFARVGTVFILLLRAITSIGPQILGLSVMLAPILSLGLGLSLGPWIFLPSIIMASFGYLIKCSQNLKNHYRKTMNDIFQVDVSDNEDYYESQLDALYKERKEKLELAFEKKYPTRPSIIQFSRRSSTDSAGFMSPLGNSDPIPLSPLSPNSDVLHRPSVA